MKAKKNRKLSSNLKIYEIFKKKSPLNNVILNDAT